MSPRNIITLAALCLSAVAVMAADPVRSGRVDTRVLSGQTVNVRDEMLRAQWPQFILTNTANPILITNVWEGQYFMAPTNPGLAAVTFGLPNPTNNYPRKFVFIGLGNSQFFISNGAGGQLTITSSNIVAPVCLIASNRMAMAWSSGTNWLLMP